METEFSWFFYYDETSPTFLRWGCSRFTNKRGRTRPRLIGDVAGYVDKSGGYAKVEHLGEQTYVHKIIYQLFHGNLEDDDIVDHIDGNPSNNNITNLVKKTPVQNMRNRKRGKNNVSGVVGVWFDKRKGLGSWVATWKNLDNTAGKKSFSVLRFGDEVAFQMACEHRKKVIDELNKQGAGYTQRHIGDLSPLSSTLTKEGE